MVIHLAFILFVPIHFRHCLQGLEHGVHDLIICRIYTFPHRQPQPVGADRDELILDAMYVLRELLDERCNPFTLFGRDLGLFYRFELVVL